MLKMKDLTQKFLGFLLVTDCFLLQLRFQRFYLFHHFLFNNFELAQVSFEFFLFRFEFDSELVILFKDFFILSK